MSRTPITALLLLVVLALQAHSLTAKYQISKTYLSHPPAAPTRIGTLIIRNSVPHVEPTQPSQFVTAAEIAQHGTVILVFRNVESGQELRTAVSGVQYQRYGEKLVVVTSSGKNKGVMAINYLQTKDHNKEIYAELSEPKPGIFNLHKKEKAVAQEPEESFFSKYKWPLIIGGVVLFMTMNGGAQDKPAGAAQ